ncbi:hypothetical protein SFUMM280S_05769 [Streptomyces fumanus]
MAVPTADPGALREDGLLSPARGRLTRLQHRCELPCRVGALGRAHVGQEGVREGRDVEVRKAGAGEAYPALTQRVTQVPTSVRTSSRPRPVRSSSRAASYCS